MRRGTRPPCGIRPRARAGFDRRRGRSRALSGRRRGSRSGTGEPLQESIEIVEVCVDDLDAAALLSTPVVDRDPRAERAREALLEVAHRGGLALGLGGLGGLAL